MILKNTINRREILNSFFTNEQCGVCVCVCVCMCVCFPRYILYSRYVELVMYKIEKLEVIYKIGKV